MNISFTFFEEPWPSFTHANLDSSIAIQVTHICLIPVVYEYRTQEPGFKRGALYFGKLSP